MSLKAVVLFCAIAACYGSRPPYIGCQTTAECGKEACCVIGMGRYSIPACRPHKEVGESCRPSVELVNTTLHYPDGVSVDLTDVYYMFCPCQAGLICSEGAECVDHLPSNHLQEYDYSEEKNFHY